MKRITCVVLFFGALACTESNNTEEKDQTGSSGDLKHKKELKRYHADQTDQKRMVFLSGSLHQMNLYRELFIFILQMVSLPMRGNIKMAYWMD